MKPYPEALFVRLPERTAARLRDAAQAREQTIAEFVRQVLRQALDEARERPVA
jgi:predicted HicB family RNase H-like nuclease